MFTDLKQATRLLASLSEITKMNNRGAGLQPAAGSILDIRAYFDMSLPIRADKWASRVI